jgi:hypothetical protein
MTVSRFRAIYLTLIALLAFTALARQAVSVDWSLVDEAMGLTGETQDGDVHKFSLPRSDLQVSSDDVEIQPAFALGTWVAFKATENGDEAVMTGDLVLTADEVNSAILALQEGGIGQTAIHKHLPDESPPIWWMHVGAQGDPVEQARAVRGALERTATPLEPPEGGQEPGDLGFDTAALDEIIGHAGEADGGIYKYSIPHAETVTIGDVEIPPPLGTAIALNFQPTGDGQAAINGDFVMLAEEVGAVIQALREHDIEVVSLHNHMTLEEPRLFFMHFWQVGEPAELARGLRAALDQVETRGE